MLAHKTELVWLINRWRPAVICLAETHITEELEEVETIIEGYKEVHAFSTSRYTGGASIYIKEELHYSVIVNEILEKNMWLIGINLNIKGQKYNILSVYHSPSSSDSKFLSKLDEIIEDYATKPDTFVLVGDFNVNVARDTFYSEKLKTIVSSHGMYQLVQGFTRVKQNSSTMIDLIITNDKTIKHQVHHTPKVADHSILTIDFPHVEAVTETILFRDMNNFNELQFQLDLMDSVWPDSMHATDDIARCFVQTISDRLDQHAPLVEKRIYGMYGNKKWWSPEIKERVSRRDRLYKRAIITGQYQDWESYKQERNKVVQLIRTQKQTYYHGKIDEVGHDEKEMWRTLKSLISGPKTTKNREGVIFENCMEREDTKIAESFNNYFLDSIPVLSTHMEPRLTGEILNNIETPIIKFEQFNLLDMRELRNIVNSLKNKKSSVDGISVKILKIAFEAIGDRFLQLVNSSLETGSFPKDWKLSTIVPIEKVRNTKKCEEYRPINMVPTYEKLLETVVSKQMRKYIEDNRLLTEFQAGFRKKHSCESALQTVISRWKNSLSKKNVVGVVFLDFRRAFETINRSLLKQKLEKNGFQGTVLKWFTEYLECRTQQTRYNNAVSSVKINSCGVPQGTVMGPDLFVLYINDIVKIVKHCELQLFADDTILFLQSDNMDNLIKLINEDLGRLYKWLCDNSLSVNIKKTKFMLIKNKNCNIDTDSHDNVLINGVKIEKVKEFKYLGVLIDEFLTFSSHANYLIKKVSKKIYFLCRIGKDLSSWTKLLIYKTIILPHFNYCASIMYMFAKSDLDVLQRKQNIALRCILKCNRYTRIKDMLETTNLLSVRQNIYFCTMIVVYKIKNGLYPEHILRGLQFVSDVHNHDTRNKSDFYVSTVQSSFAQNSLFHKGLVEFNNLPGDIKVLGFVDFKHRLRKFIVETYNYV